MTLPGSLDPADIAMEAERGDPAPDSPARRVLLKHEQLLDQQIALARNERFRNRIKTARDLSISGLAVLAALGAGVFVWDASRARGVVVEPFRTSPALAEAGLDGASLSARLLDRLARLQADSVSVRASDNYTSDWGEALALAIPSTGVTVGELQTWLRRRIGGETRITGEVYPGPKGVIVSVRTGTEPAAAHAGPVAQMDRLLDEAAQELFAQTQPYRYAVWLRGEGRRDEARAAFEALTRSGPKEERAWAWRGLAFADMQAGRYVEALAAGRESLRLDPQLAVTHRLTGEVHRILGHERLAVATFQQDLDALEANKKVVVEQDVRQQLMGLDRIYIASAFGDHLRALEEAERISESDPSNQIDSVDALIGLHEPGRALERLRTQTALPANRDDAAELKLWREHRLGLLLLDARPADALAAFGRARLAAGSRADLLSTELTLARPAAALTHARMGDAAAAKAAIAETPLDCHLCVRTRGQLAVWRGDAADADRWFAEAVRQAPNLPVAYSDWGEAKLARGDEKGAIRLFREAQKRGARWADPLKLEGDALARQGEHRAAIRRYREAAECAPRWGALHLAWGRSLQALGREAQAQEFYRQAALLDLSPADRAAVTSLLARRAA